MARYSGTVTTSRPPEEVFDYLADFSSVAEWDPGVKEAYPVNSGGVRRGARFKVISRFLGRDVPLTYRTVELDRPHRVVLRATSDTVVSNDAISFRPTPNGGTLVTYDADLRLKGALRLAELPMRVLFRRIGERARDGLEEALA
jgi:carbon monoxide dehydrogenase subunit G